MLNKSDFRLHLPNQLNQLRESAKYAAHDNRYAMQYRIMLGNRSKSIPTVDNDYVRKDGKHVHG